MKEKNAHLQAFLNKQSWWKSVIDVYHVMLPVMYAIHNLDQKAPNLGKVWMNWWTVQQNLEKPKQLKKSIMEKEWQVPFTTK